MNRDLKPEERLIVAADFNPPADYPGDPASWVRDQVLVLARRLRGTGVILKVNSALRARGYDLIDEIHGQGLKVFADLKLIDIVDTLNIDGALLRERGPELVTAMCVAGVKALTALRESLPGTEVLGVTVLTSLDDSDTDRMFSCSVEEAVTRFAKTAAFADLGGLICSPKEISVIKSIRPAIPACMTINTPNIRPLWSIVENDNQNKNRSMTPAEAIKAGADRVVAGRPIVRAEKPYDAVMRTIEEIAEAMEKKEVKV